MNLLQKVIDQLCFESDSDFVINTVMPLAIAGNFFTREEFTENYHHFFDD